MKGVATVVRKEFLELWGTSTQQWSSWLTAALMPVLVMVFSVMVYMADPLLWQWGGVVFIPGAMVVVLVFFTAESFTGERERHTLETLLAAPVGEWSILSGKVLAHLLMGLGTGLSTLLLVWVAVLPFGAGALSVAPLALILSLVFIFHAFLFAEAVGVFVGQRATTVAGANAVIMPFSVLPIVLVGMMPTLGTDLVVDQQAVDLEELATTLVGWLAVVSWALAIIATPFILHKNQAHRLLKTRS